MVPPGMRVRDRWLLGTTMVVAILVCGGFCGLWLWPRSSSGLVDSGLDAYARGDWKAALNLAREQLKDAHNDIPALQLLARSSVKLGLNSSALSLYQRLGP
jgi:hypothetical protein